MDQLFSKPMKCLKFLLFFFAIFIPTKGQLIVFSFGKFYFLLSLKEKLTFLFSSREFLELDAELPRANQTSTLSSKNVLKMISKVHCAYLAYLSIVLSSFRGCHLCPWSAVFRIRDVYAGSGSDFSITDPGSKFFHPGSASKNFKYYSPKKWFLSSRIFDPGCSSRIRILTFYPSWMPDPGVKKAPNLVSGSATLRIRMFGSSGSRIYMQKLFFDTDPDTRFFRHVFVPTTYVMFYNL
jgi:hypothetical protein